MRKWTGLLAATATIALATPALANNHAAPVCDRDCLIALGEAYAQALIADEPGAVQWAAGAVVMEALEPITAGDGAFDTITGDGDDHYLVTVPDPVSRQVGVLRMMVEGDAPVLVGFRLQLNEAGVIEEAEHLIARDLSEGQLENLQKARKGLQRKVPEAWADSRGRLIWLGESYYDALDRNNSNYSNMADDCVRHENGFQTARNSFTRPGDEESAFSYLGGLGCAAQMDTNMWEYIDTIENRRVEIADTETGLVWGMSHFHHDMAEETTPLINVPFSTERDMSRFDAFDMPAIHIYKVWGGAIHEIEALGVVMPYQSAHSFED
ncbi:hypothetical protein [Alteraurantiacibacter aquimixticola]|uniref:DUF8021 domain-containing protein n=1 Tax=Alteraurantiacibacter aquimixticola TaxID=2489173 RepID=A0A4T3EY58_9SPHN|nr:hypothetical protein [Alteraurantiacibacter aquimixticola]TIX49579.1 hypothetical protein E5222_12115 [Alteraurantiacibacter aquimixticola]